MTLTAEFKTDWSEEKRVYGRPANSELQQSWWPKTKALTIVKKQTKRQT